MLKTKQENLSKLLRKIRRDADLSQKALAKRIFKSQSYISRYENGVCQIDLIEIETLCKECGISLLNFVERYQKN